jgi:glycosyltransferase involved in cell wall biosynthesis
VPNGVEASWLQSRVVNPAEQGILQEVRTPIAGYVGSMREWFDEALVLEAARAMPGVTFVLVGPVEDPSRLEGLKGQMNVVFTGRIAHEDVPRYVARFDVALIPFRAGRVAERTDPVKLYEYFALGKPVVATPMSELEQFTPGRLVYLGEKESGFVEALRAGMDDHDEARRLARMQVARENTWERAASTMLTTILETIDA